MNNFRSTWTVSLSVNLTWNKHDFPEPVVMANREFNEISFVILDHNQKISVVSLEHVSLFLR